MSSVSINTRQTLGQRSGSQSVFCIKHHPYIFVVAIAVPMLSSGCSGTELPGESGGQGGTTVCKLNTDCERWEVCDYGECRAECLEDRDCEAGEACFIKFGFGCEQDDFSPPQPVPPREINFDIASGTDVVFEGCLLDADCRVGEECSGNICVTVDPTATCTWSSTPLLGIQLVASDSSPTRLAHGTTSRLACRLLQTDSESLVLIYIYDNMRFHTVLSPIVSPTTETLCTGVVDFADGYAVTVPVGFNWYAYSISDDGVLLDFSRIKTAGTPGETYASARLIPGFTLGLIMAWEAGGMSYVKRGRPDGIWQLVFEGFGVKPSVALHNTTMVATTRLLDGVLTHTNGEVSKDGVTTGHRGLSVHGRGEGVFGWFSVNNDGELFYSYGNLDTSWQTETTGLVDADTFGFASNPPGLPVFDLIPADIATSKNGDPILAYMAATGEYHYIMKADGHWRTGHTNHGRGFNEYIGDIKVSLVGCGRPLIEVIPAPTSGGWLFYEAR